MNVGVEDDFKAWCSSKACQSRVGKKNSGRIEVGFAASIPGICIRAIDCSDGCRTLGALRFFVSVFVSSYCLALHTQFHILFHQECPRAENRARFAACHGCNMTGNSRVSGTNVFPVS